MKIVSGIYKHFKGRFYMVYGVVHLGEIPKSADLEIVAKHTETKNNIQVYKDVVLNEYYAKGCGEDFVIYKSTQSPKSPTWCRPISMFTEDVTRNGLTFNRFEKILELK